MDAREYQEKAHQYAQYGENAMYPALGLCEEAGEVAGKIAKFIRKHEGIAPRTMDGVALSRCEGAWGDANRQFREDLGKELGDVMWMVAELCSVYHLDMGEVMERNLAKLADRQARNVIVGEGDNR